nr:uncharacterized protein LOC122592511 isoform X2 [Erigeron canadensis]XP_043620695.1 uncharacterized protein LOC122592511 isoform X2 [Erigeron canadensis]
MAPKCSATTASVWNWVIEALASDEQVDTSTLLGLMKAAPVISGNAGNHTRELVSLRILESLFDGNEAVVDAASAKNTKVSFDTSERCEDVLFRILHEKPKSMAKLDKEKWDVRPFLMHKRSSLPKCVLKKLKDVIHENSHPLLASLKEKSKLVMAHICKDTGPVIDNIQDALDNNNLDLNPGKDKNEFKEVVWQETDQLGNSTGGTTEQTGREERQRVLERSKEEASGIKLVENDAHTNSQPDRQMLHHNGENFLPDTYREYDGRHEKITNSETFDDVRTDIAAQKAAFFNSQFTLSQLSQDSFSMTEFLEMDLCMKCNEGGQLLVCSSESCQLRVHESCLGSAFSLDDNHKFFCPFCAYSRAISEYLEAKQKASLARKGLQAFSSFTVKRIPKKSSKKQCESEKNVTEAFPEMVERNGEVNTASRANNCNRKSNEDNSAPPGTSIQVANDDMHIETGCLDQQATELTQNPIPQASSPKQKGKVRDTPRSNESTCSTRLSKRKAQYNCESNEEGSGLPNPPIQDVNDDMHIETGCLNKSTELPPSPIPEASGSKQKVEIRKVQRSTEPISSERSCRRKAKYICPPPIPRSRRNIIPWTKAEEEMLKEGVGKYSSAMNNRIPWNEILDFGRNVFHKGRTNIDLKDKWRNMCNRSHDA